MQSTLRVVLTRRGEGESAGASAATATVESDALSDLAPPSIGGVAQLGETLTAEPGIWSGAGALHYAYQWEAESA